MNNSCRNANPVAAGMSCQTQAISTASSTAIPINLGLTATGRMRFEISMVGDYSELNSDLTSE